MTSDHEIENISEEKGVDTVTTIVPEKYKPMFYINKLPKTAEEKDSIHSLRNTTYYQLGLIYKEQFKETELAMEKLKKLLSFASDQRFVLGANYHLYKMYKAQNASLANLYKEVVVSQFPNSIFAKMILQPESYRLGKEGKASLEAKYKEIYYLYSAENYQEALQEIEKAFLSFEGDKLQAKLALLRAYVFIKIGGKEAYKKALEFVVLNYSNSEEQKRAKQLLTEIK